MLTARLQASPVPAASKVRDAATPKTLALLLALSGAASLVYQVLWIKQLSLVVGVEVHAVSIAVSAFFAGLAAGGWWLGRQADRLARPLRLCAGIEAGIAAVAIGTTVALSQAAPAFVALQDTVGPLAWALPLLLVAAPAFLMGGTLPVVLRAAQPEDGQVASEGGRLYAANTGGAIIGTLLASFLLIPWLGVQGSALAAAFLNLAAGGLAWGLDRNRPSLAVAPAVDGPSTGSRIALVVYALAGGLALGYEVVWSQAIVQFMSTRAFAFSVVLATYLAGLVIGSAWQSRRMHRVADPWSRFGLLIGFAGLSALLLVAGLGEWLLKGQAAAAAAAHAATGSPLVAMSTRFLVAALCIVFVPTLLLGAAFPIMLRLSADARQVGRDMGRVVALNTLGGIAGTLLTGFLLVPSLGLVHTLGVLALAAAALGLVAVRQGVRPRLRWAAVGVAGAAVLAAWATPTDRLASLLTAARGGTLVTYEESRGGTVAVVEQQSQGHRFRRLYIQGVSNSGDSMTSLRYMRLQALLPLIVHAREPRSALVIGLGTGITAGSLLAYPGLERRVVAELLPAVVRAAPQFSGNFNVTGDARMDIRVRDGRRELLRSTERYDLVTLEPPPPSAAGVVNLYSTDFYRLAARRLEPGGIVAQWLPLPTQNVDDTRALVRSFLDVFPHATLWTTEFHEMLLVGSLEPLELDVPRIRDRFAQPGVAKALAEVGVDSAASLMGTWVTDRAGLERFAGDAPAVTDDQPRIEYAPWVTRDAFVRSLDGLFLEMSDPPLRGADAAFMADVKSERERLVAFYRAGLHAYAGDREAWAATIRRVMEADGRNPYYRWLVGTPQAPRETDR